MEKLEKDEVGGGGGVGEEASWKSAKHLSCDKSISVFNRVEKMCACMEGVKPMDERAENTGPNQSQRS